jgi:DNA polymerase-3 subunit gamma/tau
MAAQAAPQEPEPGVTTETVRRRWPEVLGALAAARVTWSLVGPNAQVAALEGNTLKLGFAAPGLARTFSNARHTSAVEEAVYQTLGIKVRVEATLDEGPSGGTEASGGSGGGPSGGVSSGGGPSGGGPASSGEPRREAPAPAAAPAADWPDVPPPGGGTATASGPSAPVDAVAVAGATGASAASGGPARGSAAVATVVAQGSVAVAERPEPSRPEPTGPEPGRPEPSRPAARPPSVANAADEAWLSGASATEPPADYDMPEPDPVYEEQASAPARPPMSGAGGAREALRQANERRARAASAAVAEPRRGATADAGASVQRTATPADEPDLYDEPSADDPDIASAGMVGVPLVVQVLGGTVIDEILEQP